MSTKNLRRWQRGDDGADAVVGRPVVFGSEQGCRARSDEPSLGPRPSRAGASIRVASPPAKTRSTTSMIPAAYPPHRYDLS